jgi:hypothetical protein
LARAGTTSVKKNYTPSINRFNQSLIREKLAELVLGKDYSPLIYSSCIAGRTERKVNIDFWSYNLLRKVVTS